MGKHTSPTPAGLWESSILIILSQVTQNQVNQASFIGEEREGLISPAKTQPCKWEAASGLVSVNLSKTSLVAASLLTAFGRVLLC